MKKLFNRITEKQARVLTLCLLGAAVVLLGAALWLNLRAGGSGTTLTTYAMGSYIQQTVYGTGAEEAAQQASSAVTELENLISWRVEDSDIATLNQEAARGVPGHRTPDLGHPQHRLAGVPSQRRGL